MTYIFRSFCRLYGERFLFELSANEIQEWLDIRCFAPPNTYNHYLKAVCALYSIAIKRKCTPLR